MLSTAQKFRGKYFNVNGPEELTLSVTRVFISGKQPFEVLIKRNDGKDSGLMVIQRATILLVYFCRYPTTVDEIDSRVLMFTSTYIFELDEDGRMNLELTVKREDGGEVNRVTFFRVDTVERKYSITTDPSSR